MQNRVKKSVTIFRQEQPFGAGRPIFLMMIVFLSAFHVQGQKMKLKAQDQNRLDRYHKLSKSAGTTHYNEALLYADSAYRLAESLRYNKGMADALIEKCNLMTRIDNKVAQKYILEADSLYHLEGDFKGETKCKRILGILTMNQGRFPESLQYYQQALRLAEKFKLAEEFPMIYTNLSILYSYRSDQVRSRSYLYLAKQKAEEAGMKDLLGSIYANLGVAYHQSSMLDSAEYFYQKALEIAKKINHTLIITAITGNLGSIYENRYEYDKAIRFYHEGEMMGRKQGDDAFTARNMTKTGELWYKSALDTVMKRISGSAILKIPKEQRMDKGIALLTDALDIYRKIGEAPNEVWVLRFLSDAYSLKGDFKKALQSYRLSVQLDDSMSRIQKDKEIADLEAKRENELKDREIEILKQKELAQQARLAREKMRRNGLIIGMALVSLAAFVFFRQRNVITKEKNRSETLLLNILPEEIAKELKENGQAEARLIQQVTVLFTDFKDFTQVAETMSPSELVAEINVYFSEFDHIMDKYGIEKIKTIGDAYMAAGGLPTENVTNHLDVAAAAVEILDFIARLKAERIAKNKAAFDIRIGIHSGPVVAGIVGVKKFAYDIWGDTVNTAARMESSGAPGKINISQDTYELVKEKYHCTYRGKLQAKHKGEMDMYFLEGEVLGV